MRFLADKTNTGNSDPLPKMVMMMAARSQNKKGPGTQFEAFMMTKQVGRISVLRFEREAVVNVIVPKVTSNRRSRWGGQKSVYSRNATPRLRWSFPSCVEPYFG